MKLKEIWIFRHPSGEIQEFEVAYVNVRGADLIRRNNDAGGTQWWSEMFIQRETEKGNLYKKPEG